MPIVISSGGGASAPMTGDPFFSDVKLLTHLDEDPPLDRSPLAHVITRVAGSIQATRKLFGAGAYDAENLSNGRCSIPDHAGFNPGSGAYTGECWALFHSVPSAVQALMSQWDSPSNQRGWNLHWANTAGGAIRLAYSTDGIAEILIDTNAFTPAANTWYHFAWDRDTNDDLRIYIDGAVRKTQNISGVTFHDSTALFTMGANAGSTNKLNGVIEEVRLTGIGRYGGAFTPSGPFPDF